MAKGERGGWGGEGKDKKFNKINNFLQNRLYFFLEGGKGRDFMNIINSNPSKKKSAIPTLIIAKN